MGRVDEMRVGSVGGGNKQQEDVAPGVETDENHETGDARFRMANPREMSSDDAAAAAAAATGGSMRSATRRWARRRGVRVGDS